MKVLYISADFYPPVRAAAIRAQFNVAALRETGFEVLVLTCDSGNGPGAGVVTISQPPPSNSLGLILRLLYELRLGCAFIFRISRHYSKGDLLVFSTPPFFAMSVCVLVSICLGWHYILDVRDRYPKVFLSLGLLSKKAPLFRLMEWWEKFMYRKATALSTVTNALGVEFSIDTDVMPVVVRNGFDERFFIPEIEESDSTRITVVSHGVFGKFFDIDSFLQIARHCYEKAQEHEFLLIGYGPKLVQLQAMKLPNVQIVGESSQQDIAKMLAKCHIGLSLHKDDESMRAAFPVKIFEFIGCGLPIFIMPRNEAGLEMESKGMGWCFSASQVDVAACRLVEMIQSSKLRSQCKRSVLSRRGDYSRQQAAKKFADLVRPV